MTNEIIPPDQVVYKIHKNPLEVLKRDVHSFLTEYVTHERIKSFRKPETLASQVTSIVTYTIVLYNGIEIEIVLSFLERNSENDFSEYFIGNRINIMINKNLVCKKKVYKKIREHLVAKKDMGLETRALKVSQEYIIQNLRGRIKKVSEVQLDSSPYFGGLLFKWERICGRIDEFIVDIRPTLVAGVSANEMNYKRKEKHGKEFLVPIEIADLVKKPNLLVKKIKKLATKEFP